MGRLREDATAPGPEWLGWLDAVPQPTIAIDATGCVLHVNRSAQEVIGEQPDHAVVGRPVAELLFDQDSRGGFEDVLSVVRHGGAWTGPLTVVPRHGVPCPAVVGVRPVTDGAAEGKGCAVVVVTLDETAGWAPSGDEPERLTRLAKVAAELVLADSVEAVTRIVVDHLAEAAGATVASLSLLVDEQSLRMVGVRGGRDGVGVRWATYPLDSHTPAAEAVRTGRVVVLHGRAEIQARFPDLESAADGERSIACLPLRVGDRAIGVASLSYPGAREVSSHELDFLAVMADTCAQALERVRMGERAADRAAKLQFLADSSIELSSSLDYETTLTTVARLAVPRFADWCAIALAQDGELRTLAVEHVDPAKVELALELQRRFPPDPAAPSGGYQVLRTGRSEITPEITDAMLDTAISDAEERRLLDELDLRSVMIVPLKVNDRVLGVATWAAASDGRRFGPEDLVFAEDLARRAALAIDTAALHSELSDVATRLQRAVLPGELPHVPGWQTAASYLQAGASEAGGDFYDVTSLGDGRVAWFVGDVMGRGVTAAAAMAQTRAAIRALVLVEPDPERLLTALDRLFDQYDFGQLVTLVYGVADPARGDLLLGNAGHLPPVVRRADGRVEVLAGEPGLLLGAGGAARSALRVPFGPGDLLLAYTDGLVERRDEDIETGIERIAAACVAAEPGGLPDWLAEVVRRVRDPRREDDVALLALRRVAQS